MGYVLLGIITLVEIEFGWRVIHYAATGKGGPEDPLILPKEERNWKPKKGHKSLFRLRTKKKGRK